MDDRFSYQSILNTNGIALSYNNQIKNFLEIIGFEHIWQNKGTFSKLKLVHAVKSKLLERYNIFFQEAVRGNITVKGRTLDKLRTFKTFKNNYKLENYINMKLDKQMIFNFARLRISNHFLEIETGRYKKKMLEQRLCKICNDDFIEDEMHFLMKCKAYRSERSEVFEKLNGLIVPFRSYTIKEKFIFLMGTNDTEVLNILIPYIDKYIKTRQSSGR